MSRLLTRIHLGNSLQRLPTAVVVAIVLALLLSLIHAHHLAQPADGHMVAAEMTDRVGSSAAKLEHTFMAVVTTSAMVCPAPRWSIPDRLLLAGLFAACLALITVAAFAGAPSRVVFHPLPVARGPDRQAVLQRFTL